MGQTKQARGLASLSLSLIHISIMLADKKILDLVATNKEKMAIKVPSPKTQILSLIHIS